MEEQEKLENQEIWAKVFFNGYFCTFRDMTINIEITLQDSEHCTTHILYPALEDVEGKVDLTNLLHTFLSKMKENPGKEVKAYLSSFGRQMHFDKDLLSRQIPQAFLDMFSKRKDNLTD